MNHISHYLELDVAMIAGGGALVGYGVQHDIAWLVCFGSIWILGNFIKTIAKYEYD